MKGKKEQQERARSRFQRDLEKRLADCPLALHFIQQYLRRNTGALTAVKTVLRLTPGTAAYLSSLNAAEADIRFEAAKTALSLAAEWRQIQYRALNLAVAGQTGEDTSNAEVDPSRCAVVIKLPRKCKSGPASLSASLEEYAALIREALHHPFVAHRMAHDEHLPGWLQQLSERITAPDLGKRYRVILEGALEDSNTARRWYEAGGDSGLETWFVEAMRVLAMRKT